MNLKQVFDEGTNEQKRLLFRTYIRRMAYDPDTGDTTVVFYPPYLQEDMKRGPNGPRYISAGAGSPTHIVCTAPGPEIVLPVPCGRSLP
jgi:hypothetical protein